MELHGTAQALFKGRCDENADVRNVIVRQNHISTAAHHNEVLMFCHVTDQITLVEKDGITLTQTMIAAELRSPSL